jgi:hypothetical protein
MDALRSIRARHCSFRPQSLAACKRWHQQPARRALAVQCAKGFGKPKPDKGGKPPGERVAVDGASDKVGAAARTHTPLRSPS